MGDGRSELVRRQFPRGSSRARIDAIASRKWRSSGRWPNCFAPRGILLPAVSIVRDGWAVMIVCPFTLEAELIAMIRAGYKVIGQRWTASARKTAGSRCCTCRA